MNKVDKCIAKYIKQINNLGYQTVLSCSGMQRDHYNDRKCPFICFVPPHLFGEEMNQYLRFIGDCLYNSNWFVEFFPHYIVGYLPWGLKDSNIKNRFHKFVSNLRMRDFFKHSY